MKSFKNTSIITLIFGCVFLVCNFYKYIFSSPVYDEDDLPLLIFNFTSVCISIYVFTMLRKFLSIHLKSARADRLLVWIVRLEVITGVVGFVTIFSLLTYGSQEIDVFAQEDFSFLIKEIVEGFLNYILLTGVTIFLAIKYILFGNQLNRIKDKTYLFFATGMIAIIYGILLLLNTFLFIDDSYLLPLVKSLIIISIGLVFRKYGDRKIKEESKPKEQIHIEEEPHEEPYKKLVDFIEEEIVLEKDIEEAEVIKENKIDKEDHSRFMPK